MRGRRMPGVRGLAIEGVLVLMIATCASLSLKAAPVTFAFEAEVIRVDEKLPADLPFSVETGDILTGRFTFEPVDAEPDILGTPPNLVLDGPSSTDTVQEFNFSITIDSTVVSTSSYALQARDNSPAIDAPFFTDNISLSCSSVGSNSCQPGTVPDAENIIWFFRLSIGADGSSLAGADISADPEVWSQFAGQISLTFQDKGIADVLSLSAQINNFTVVPEPSAQCLFLPVIVALFATRWPADKP